MPQQAKFSKEEIIKEAIKIVEERGMGDLTARALGKNLGTSARPIFTTFKNMEEVFNGVMNEADKIYQGYVEEGLNESIAFKGVGRAYIRFAKEHPKLFQLLFMKEQAASSTINTILGRLDGSYQKILNSITDNYNVSEAFAKELYQHLWIYSHGIAVLIVTKVCDFEGEEVSNMLTEVFKSLLINGAKQ